MPELESFMTEESEEEECSDVQEDCPRVDRNLNYEANFQKMMINVAFTKYPIVREVARRLKWTLVEDRKDGKWDLCWTDIPIRPQTLIRMHFHQSINYIPGIVYIARKDCLAHNLNLMRRKFPADYHFYPRTWILPQDYSPLRKEHCTRKFTFIVKPFADCQGRGIFLTSRLQEIRPGKKCVVQQYVANPFLLDSLKFDLRIYALIGSIDPLKIYLYEEGLARFATEAYQPPERDNFASNFLHLTNYAVNKKNPVFRQPNETQSDACTHKRSLTKVFEQLRGLGCNTVLLRDKIKDIIIKTILTCYERIRYNYVHCQPQDYHNRMAFHILGFDILINDKFQPCLLEVNHTPSFATDSELDKKIKGSLIADTLKLLCFHSQLKQTLFQKAKNATVNRIENGIKQNLNEDQRIKKILENQPQIQEYRQSHLGKYEQIYPVSDMTKYEEFLLQAKKLTKTTQIIKEKVQRVVPEIAIKTINAQRRISHSRTNSNRDIGNNKKIQTTSPFILIKKQPSVEFKIQKTLLNYHMYYNPELSSMKDQKQDKKRQYSSLQKKIKALSPKKIKSRGVFLKPKTYDLFTTKIDEATALSKDHKNLFISVRL